MTAVVGRRGGSLRSGGQLHVHASHRRAGGGIGDYATDSSRRTSQRQACLARKSKEESESELQHTASDPQKGGPVARGERSSAIPGRGAVTVHDSTLCQIVRRELDIDSIAWKYSDSMSAHPAGNVSEDRVAVFQLYGERRAWENLFDAPRYLDRALFGVLRR